MSNSLLNKNRAKKYGQTALPPLFIRIADLKLGITLWFAYPAQGLIVVT